MSKSRPSIYSNHLLAEYAIDTRRPTAFRASSQGPDATSACTKLSIATQIIDVFHRASIEHRPALSSKSSAIKLQLNSIFILVSMSTFISVVYQGFVTMPNIIESRDRQGLPGLPTLRF